MNEQDQAAMDAVMANDLPIPPRVKTWAIVEKGFVTDVRRTFDALKHPFGADADGKIVLDVTGVPCAVGYIADHKGNVAPSNGMTEPLLPHEPAYHDRNAVPPAPAAAQEVALATAEPHPVMKAGKDQADGDHDNHASGTSVDHTTDNDVDAMRAEHPTAAFVQERGVVQGETKPDDQPG